MMMKSRTDTIMESRERLGRGACTDHLCATISTGTMEALDSRALCWGSKLNDEEGKEPSNMSQQTKMHVCLAA